MKFGKNLSKVVDIADPEWAPYWTNYKMLKKLIKELPTLVPKKKKQESQFNGKKHLSLNAKANNVNKTLHQQGRSNSATKLTAKSQILATRNSTPKTEHNQKSIAQVMGKSPGEIAFFKLLHSEFKKSCCFFKNAEEEMAIREARVQEGNEIMKTPNSIMVNDRWSLLSKSLYRLYKDLLLLETYAIMTYVTFSKILKKHDKMTGFTTRNQFMGNVVSKANFTTYPKLVKMIDRTEALYEEVSSRLVLEGKNSLYEDERLFIDMIHRLSTQALENEDAPNVRPRKNESLNDSGRCAQKFDDDSLASSVQSVREDGSNDGGFEKTATSTSNTGQMENISEAANSVASSEFGHEETPIKKQRLR